MVPASIVIHSDKIMQVIVLWKSKYITFVACGIFTKVLQINLNMFFRLAASRDVYRIFPGVKRKRVAHVTFECS